MCNQSAYLAGSDPAVARFLAEELLRSVVTATGRCTLVTHEPRLGAAPLMGPRRGGAGWRAPEAGGALLEVPRVGRLPQRILVRDLALRQELQEMLV